MLDGLEAAHRSAELVAFRDVVDGHFDGPPGCSDQQRSGEGAPLVDGSGMGCHRLRALGQHLTVLHRPVGYGHVGMVGLGLTGGGAPYHHQSVVLEGHQHLGHRPGRNRSGQSAGGRADSQASYRSTGDHVVTHRVEAS